MLTASQLCPALSVWRTAKKAKKWPEKRKQSQSLCLKNEKVSIYFNLGFSVKLKHVWGDRKKKKVLKFHTAYIPRPDQQVTKIFINIIFDTKRLIQMGKINLDEITCRYLWWYTVGYFNPKFAKMVLNHLFQTLFA